MNVFFDIGTNYFQGYEEIAKILNIDDTWVKVFIEPNPNFLKDKNWLNKLSNIKNSSFLSAAMCCGCKQDQSELMFVDGFNDLDQGASIFNKDWKNKGVVKKSIIVDLVSFDDVCKKHLNDEWYIKFDCENCEYYCLKEVINKYHKNIKYIACEFHYPSPKGFEAYKQDIIKLAESHGIQFVVWK